MINVSGVHGVYIQHIDAKTDKVIASFSLRLAPDSILSSSQKQSKFQVDPLRNWGVSWNRADQGKTGWIKGDNFRLQMPTQSNIRWPIYPFNPYAINNAAPPEQAVAIVSTELTIDQKEKHFVLEIE